MFFMKEDIKNNKTKPDKASKNTDPKEEVDSSTFFNKNFYFFAGSAVVGILALFFLSQINFTVVDLFKYPQVLDSLKQFISISFIQFVVLFAISVSLALNSMLKGKQKYILFPSIILLFFVLSFAFNLNWSLAISLALILGLCAISRSQESSLGSNYGNSSLPFLAGIILLSLFLLLTFQNNKEAMVNDFFASAQSAAPDLQSKVVNFCLTPVENELNSGSLFKNAMSFEEFKQKYYNGEFGVLAQTNKNTTDAELKQLYDDTAKASDDQAKKFISQLKAKLSAVQLPNDTKTRDKVKSEILNTDIGKTVFSNLPVFLTLSLIPIFYTLSLIIRIIAFIISIPLYYNTRVADNKPVDKQQKKLDA